MARKKGLYRWERKAKNLVEERLLRDDFTADLVRFKDDLSHLDPKRIRSECVKFAYDWKLPQATAPVIEHYLRSDKWDWEYTWPPARIISTKDRTIFPNSGDPKGDWERYRHQMEIKWSPPELATYLHPLEGAYDPLIIEVSRDTSALELKQFIDAYSEKLDLLPGRLRKKDDPELHSLIYNYHLRGMNAKEILDAIESEVEWAITTEDIRRIIKRQNKAAQTRLDEWRELGKTDN